MKVSGKIPQTVQSISQLLHRLVSLYMESFRLTIAEKSTMIMSAGLMLVVILVLGIFALAFLSGTCVALLSLVLPNWAGYAIMGGFFVLLILLCVIFKKALFINPIARYMSRLVFEKEQEHLK